jgi:EPS-associated MarR family transcriptional regulator
MFKSEPQRWTESSARRTARSAWLARQSVTNSHQNPPRTQQKCSGTVVACPSSTPPSATSFADPPPLSHTTPTPRSTRIQEEMRFKVLRALEQQPDLSQRQLADMLGVSLGKANYLLHALLDKGLLKARNFRNSQNKLAYAYLLTPSGIAQKSRADAQLPGAQDGGV